MVKLGVAETRRKKMIKGIVEIRKSLVVALLSQEVMAEADEEAAKVKTSLEEKEGGRRAFTIPPRCLKTGSGDIDLFSDEGLRVLEEVVDSLSEKTRRDLEAAGNPDVVDNPDGICVEDSTLVAEMIEAFLPKVRSLEGFERAVGENSKAAGELVGNIDYEAGGAAVTANEIEKNNRN